MRSNTNTRNAVRLFYIMNHNGVLKAKMAFPLFYRKMLEWLGEEPEEVDEEAYKKFISLKGATREDTSLVIPLQKRVLILIWGSFDGEVDNEIILCPRECLENENLFDDTALRKIRRLHQKEPQSVRFFEPFKSFEIDVFKG